MRSTANKSTTPRMIPSWQSRNFAWSGCNRDVREAFLCIGFEESGRPIWHLFQTDFTEIMLLFWDVFLLFHTFPRLYNAGQMFFGGASSKKNHSWRLKREFYGTQCQQAMFSSIQKHFLRCKMLVGKSQTLELHPVDAGCAIASLIRSNSSQPYIIAHTPDQDVKCRSGHLHLRKQPLHDSFCTGHCSTLFINSW